MEDWVQVVILLAAFLTSLVNLQTARLNAKIAQLKVMEAKAEKEKAAPVDAGSDH